MQSLMQEASVLKMVDNLTNPVSDLFLEPAWKYMTDNYSKFTISFWVSVLIHEVGDVVLF